MHATTVTVRVFDLIAAILGLLIWGLMLHIAVSSSVSVTEIVAASMAFYIGFLQLVILLTQLFITLPEKCFLSWISLSAILALIWAVVYFAKLVHFDKIFLGLGFGFLSLCILLLVNVLTRMMMLRRS